MPYWMLRDIRCVGTVVVHVHCPKQHASAKQHATCSNESGEVRV